MYYAQNKNKNLVHISQINKGSQYWCPMCHQEVKIRKIKNKNVHFVHFSNSQHPQLGESKIHNIGKSLLAKWGEELGYKATVEYYVQPINQRADVYLEKTNQKIVLEYQCSPITTTKLIQRSKGYKHLNYDFIWIVGKNYLLKKQITQRQAQFLHYRSNLGFYLIYLNAENQRLELFYQILKADFLPLKYQIKYFYSLVELIDFIKSTPSLKCSFPLLNSTSRQYQLRNLQRLRSNPSKSIFKIQKSCYEQRYQFDQLVDQCLNNYYEYPIYQNCGFYFRAGCFLKLTELQRYYQIPFVNLSKLIR